MKERKERKTGRNVPEYICPSASWGDMTGLIPGGEADPESYREIYPYLPEYGGEAGEKRQQN